ncbi:hypothetical protein IWZ01DRAFT_536996 [Phyllosticta capitalensis]
MDPLEFQPFRAQDLAIPDLLASDLPYFTAVVWNDACFGQISSSTGTRKRQQAGECPGSPGLQLTPSDETIKAYPALEDKNIWPTQDDVVRHHTMSGTDFSYFAAACEREFSYYGTRYLARQLLGEGANLSMPQALDRSNARTGLGDGENYSLPVHVLTYPLDDILALSLTRVPKCRFCGKTDGHVHGCRANICTSCYAHMDKHTTFPVCRYSKGYVRLIDGAVIPLFEASKAELQEIRASIPEPNVPEWSQFPKLRDHFLIPTLSLTNRDFLFDYWCRSTGFTGVPPTGFYSQASMSDPTSAHVPPWHDTHTTFMTRFINEVEFMYRLEAATAAFKTQRIENEVEARLLVRACALQNMSPISGTLREVAQLSEIYPGLSHLRPAPFTTYTSPYREQGQDINQGIHGQENGRLCRRDSAVDVEQGEEEGGRGGGGAKI